MRRPPGPLWHNRDFLCLWSAQTVSQVTGLALPLAAILVVHAREAAEGVDDRDRSERDRAAAVSVRAVDDARVVPVMP